MNTRFEFPTDWRALTMFRFTQSRRLSKRKIYKRVRASKWHNFNLFYKSLTAKRVVFFVRLSKRKNGDF